MDTRQVALRNLTRLTRWVVLDIETTNSDDGQHVLSIGINQWRLDATATQPTPSPVEWFVDPRGAHREHPRPPHQRPDPDRQARPAVRLLHQQAQRRTEASPW
jgi:DNA polymerase III epsilon subunit-like protein